MPNHEPATERAYLSDTFSFRRVSSLLPILLGLVLAPIGLFMLVQLGREILAGGFWDSPMRAAQIILLTLGFLFFNTFPGGWLVVRFVRALVSNEQREVRIDARGIHQGPVTTPWTSIDWMGYSKTPFSRHVNLLYKDFNRHNYPALLHMDHRLTLEQCNELMATLEQELEPIYPEVLFGVQRSWHSSHMSHATLWAK